MTEHIRDGEDVQGHMPAGMPTGEVADDTEGHAAKWGLEDGGTEDADDTEGHGRRYEVEDGATEDGKDDTEGHFGRYTG